MTIRKKPVIVILAMICAICAVSIIIQPAAALGYSNYNSWWQSNYQPMNGFGGDFYPTYCRFDYSDIPWWWWFTTGLPRDHEEYWLQMCGSEQSDPYANGNNYYEIGLNVVRQDDGTWVTYAFTAWREGGTVHAYRSQIAYGSVPYHVLICAVKTDSLTWTCYVNNAYFTQYSFPDHYAPNYVLSQIESYALPQEQQYGNMMGAVVSMYYEHTYDSNWSLLSCNNAGSGSYTNSNEYTQLYNNGWAAVCERPPYPLYINVDGWGSTNSAPGTYYGTGDITITESDDYWMYGYAFDHWEINGNWYSSDQSITVNYNSGTVTAVFYQYN